MRRHLTHTVLSLCMFVSQGHLRQIKQQHILQALTVFPCICTELFKDVIAVWSIFLSSTL